MSDNSFGAKDTLSVGDRELEIFRLDALQQRFDVARLPFSLKVLLENLLRTEGRGSVTAADIVVCRNVLIYLGERARRMALRSLADAVAPGGYLVLGPTDSAPAADALEAVWSGGPVIYRRRE